MTFTPDAKFATNLFKYEQGPFKLLFLRNYQIDGKKVHVHDGAQNKIIVIKHSTGEQISEFRFQAFGSLEFLYYYNSGDSLFFSDEDEEGHKIIRKMKIEL